MIINKRYINITTINEFIVAQEDLKQIFSKYGEVKQVLCRWQNSYFGYGIVKFSYKHDADRVLRQTDHVTLNGYTMSVKTARKSDHSNQNGQLGIENKNSYPDMNKNQLYFGSKTAHTDYGYFQHPVNSNEKPMVSTIIILVTSCMARCGA
ncbi:UNVERIFIED_CONTAM: hypothetical protein NCL1_25466 [Trichonephila clavipes]